MVPGVFSESGGPLRNREPRTAPGGADVTISKVLKRMVLRRRRRRLADNLDYVNPAGGMPALRPNAQGGTPDDQPPATAGTDQEEKNNAECTSD